MKKRDTSKCWQGQGFGTTATLLYCLRDYRLIRVLWKIVEEYLLKMHVPAILVLGIIIMEMHMYVHQKNMYEKEWYYS